MFKYRLKPLSSWLPAVALCAFITACGGSSGQPTITSDDDQQKTNSSSDNSSGNATSIKVSVSIYEASVQKYEDGIYVQNSTGLDFCDGYGGLSSGQRCGLLGYTVAANLASLLNLSEADAITVDYALTSSVGNITDILKSPDTATGTVKLYKDHVQHNLFFPLKSDNQVTPSRTVTLTLSNPQKGADISDVVTANSVVTIHDALTSTAQATSKINDTGVNYSANVVKGNDANCDTTKTAQDCNLGKDKTNANDADGHAGFSFTKLDANGQEVAFTADNWQCVKDNITGLVWERKTFAKESDDKDYRDSAWDYAYYDANTQLGIEDATGTCKLDKCTTATYVAKLNEVKLCGISTWRLPSKNELFNVMNFNSREGEDTLHAKLLMSIYTVDAPLDSYKPTGSTLPDSDYVDQHYRRVRSSYWTSSVAGEYGYHDGYSSPQSLKFNHIWKMLPDGILEAEDPSSKWNTSAILAVSKP